MRYLMCFWEYLQDSGLVENQTCIWSEGERLIWKLIVKMDKWIIGGEIVQQVKEKIIDF